MFHMKHYMPGTTYTLPELEATLGLDRYKDDETRAKKLKNLIGAQGFPRPLPGLKAWSRCLVDAWIRADDEPAAAPEQDPAGAAAVDEAPDPFVLAVRRRLEARIGRAAA